MARPVKWRRVEFIPSVQYFAPADTGRGAIEENILRIEELEVLRLKDIEGLEQEACAEKMGISRQTFQRILNAARRKVADSLVKGKAIRIKGGNYTLNICPVKCLDCGKEWNESYENFERILGGEYNCPECNSENVLCQRKEIAKFCGRNCQRHRCGRDRPIT